MSLLNNLDEKDQAFLLLSVLKEGDQARKYLSYLSDNKAEELTGHFEELLKIPQKLRNEKLTHGLQKLSRSKRESLLKYADAGWIAEMFRGESPRILSLLLNEIPKPKIGQMLKDLSKEVRKSIKTRPTEKVSYPILQFIRKKWEERFPLISGDLLEDLGPFKIFFSLSVENLIKCLREVGINEMAIAFYRINRSATRAILHRLNIRDAKELRNRIKDGPSYTLELQREAQLNILSLDIEKLKSEELVLEIGFSVFSKSFGKDYLPLAPLFIYKLPPKQGYILKRYIDQSPSSGSLEKALKIRERVLEALEGMDLP